MEIGRRIDFGGRIGTVRYFGPLMHKPSKSVQNTEGQWIGVEWDVKESGTSNGTIDNVKYFECEDKGGSLIRSEKASKGQGFLQTFIKKYFRDNESGPLLEKSEEELLEFFQSIHEHSLLAETEASPKEKDVELDLQAFINTSLGTKSIEFIGFKEIWKKIRDLH